MNRIEEWLFPLTKQSLADACGVTRQSIHDYVINKKTPRLTHIGRILKHLENGYMYQEEIRKDPGRGPLRIEEVWPDPISITEE